MTAAEGRRFAITLGSAFSLLAGLLWWRGRETLMAVSAGIAALFFAAALVAPARLDPVYRFWMRIGLAMSKVTAPIFLGVVYFGLITPLGFLLRRLGRDPLKPRTATRPAWITRPDNARRSDLDHQF